MMKSPIYLLSSIIYLLGSTAAFSQVIPENFSIQFKYADEDLKPENEEALRGKACEAVGNAFLKGKGPYGLGIFETFNCKPATTGWVLKILFKKTSTAVAMFDRTKKKRLALVTFKDGPTSLTAFGDPQFADLTAISILDQLPVAMRISTESYDARSSMIVGRDEATRTVEIPPPWKKIVIYQLGYDKKNKIWTPQYVTTGTMQENKASFKAKNVKDPAKWRIDGPIDPTKPLYAHNYYGRRNSSKGITTKLKVESKETHERITRNVLEKSAAAVGEFISEFATGGYFGIRYGHPLLKEDIIEDSTYIGVLFESRSGFLNGLKLYFDKWPKVEGEIDGEPGAFGGQRFILGWSFAYELDTFISSIDVTPKIGGWSFEATFPNPDEEEPALNFTVKNALSFELELGLESITEYALMRGWAAGAVTTARSKSSANVASRRAGLDVFIAGPSLGSFVISPLVFSFIDHVTLSASEDSLNSEEASIKEIVYSQAYLGLGIAVSW